MKRLFFFFLVCMVFFRAHSQEIAVLIETSDGYEMRLENKLAAWFFSIDEIPEVMSGTGEAIDHFDNYVIVSTGDTIDIGPHRDVYQAGIDSLVVIDADGTPYLRNFVGDEQYLLGLSFAMDRVDGFGQYIQFFSAESRLAQIFNLETDDSQIYLVPEIIGEVFFAPTLRREDLSGKPIQTNAVGVRDTMDGLYNSKVFWYSGDYKDQLRQIKSIDLFWLHRRGKIPWSAWMPEHTALLPVFYVDESNIHHPFFRHGRLTTATDGNGTEEFYVNAQMILHLDAEQGWVYPVWMGFDPDDDLSGGTFESFELKKFFTDSEYNLAWVTYIDQFFRSAIDWFDLRTMEYLETDFPDLIHTHAVYLAPGTTRDERDLITARWNGIRTLPNGTSYSTFTPAMIDRNGHVLWRGEDIPIVGTNCNTDGNPSDVFHTNDVSTSQHATRGQVSIMSNRNLKIARVAAFVLYPNDTIATYKTDLTEQLLLLGPHGDTVSGQHNFHWEYPYWYGDTNYVIGFDNQDYRCTGSEYGYGVKARVIWHDGNVFTVDQIEHLWSGNNGAMGSYDIKTLYDTEYRIVNSGAGNINDINNDLVYLYVKEGVECNPLLQGGIQNIEEIAGVSVPLSFPMYHIGIVDTADTYQPLIRFELRDSFIQFGEMQYEIAPVPSDIPTVGTWTIMGDTTEHISVVISESDLASTAEPVLCMTRMDPVRPDLAPVLYSVPQRVIDIINAGIITISHESRIADLSIDLYPNPTSGWLHIRAPLNNFGFVVYGTDGQKYAKGWSHSSTYTVDLDLTAGQYIIQVYDPSTGSGCSKVLIVVQ